MQVDSFRGITKNSISCVLLFFIDFLSRGPFVTEDMSLIRVFATALTKEEEPPFPDVYYVCCTTSSLIQTVREKGTGSFFLLFSYGKFHCRIHWHRPCSIILR